MIISSSLFQLAVYVKKIPWIFYVKCVWLIIFDTVKFRSVASISQFIVLRTALGGRKGPVLFKNKEIIDLILRWVRYIDIFPSHKCALIHY